MEIQATNKLILYEDVNWRAESQSLINAIKILLRL